MRPLEVRVPHALEKVEVRRRLDAAVLRARDEYAGTTGPIDASWASDDRLVVGLDVMGMRIGGEVEILAAEILVRVELPAMASLFAGRVREGVQDRLGGLLGAAGG